MNKNKDRIIGLIEEIALERLSRADFLAFQGDTEEDAEEYKKDALSIVEEYKEWLFQDLSNQLFIFLKNHEYN